MTSNSSQIPQIARWSKAVLKRMIPAHMRKTLQGRLTPANLVTYSQSGEDRILDFFINSTGLQNATYLDIGASHPIWGNNTYLLYRRGLRGVCVDPSPGLADLYRIHRPEDHFMPFAVVPGMEEEVVFQFFEESTLNTVSPDHAAQYSNFGFKRRDISRVRAINLERLCLQCGITNPDILCVDIEGLDLEVLTHADFSQSRPKLICVEVVRYLESKEPVIDHRFEDVLESKGYFKYADTYINQVFADKEFQRRQRLV